MQLVLSVKSGYKILIKTLVFRRYQRVLQKLERSKKFVHTSVLLLLQVSVYRFAFEETGHVEENLLK